MDKKTVLKDLIQLLEKRQAPLQTTLNYINQITGREIDEHEILTYSSYTSLDSFCEALLIPPITNWREADDLLLIREILNNKTNYGILLRNSEVLGKIFDKTTSRVKEVIYTFLFCDEMTILQQLDDRPDTNIS